MNDIKTLPIVLASTSPRRQELLLAAGVKFVVNAVEIDESWQAKEAPTDYINRMVLTKAQQAALNSHLPDKCLLITADTIGVIDDLVLTKPKDQADAYRMWQMAWVLSIDGSYTNVVGLPLAQTLALIDKMALQTVN